MDKSQIERILSKMKENGISKHGLGIGQNGLALYNGMGM